MLTFVPTLDRKDLQRNHRYRFFHLRHLFNPTSGNVGTPSFSCSLWVVIHDLSCVISAFSSYSVANRFHFRSLINSWMSWIDERCHSSSFGTNSAICNIRLRWMVMFFAIFQASQALRRTDSTFDLKTLSFTFLETCCALRTPPNCVIAPLVFLSGLSTSSSVPTSTLMYFLSAINFFISVVLIIASLDLEWLIACPRLQAVVSQTVNDFSLVAFGLTE